MMVVVTIAYINPASALITMPIGPVDDTASAHHSSSTITQVGAIVGTVVSAGAIGYMPMAVIILSWMVGIELLAGKNQCQSCQKAEGSLIHHLRSACRMPVNVQQFN